MYASFKLVLLSVQQYLSLSRTARRGMIPAQPGIYIWTADLRDLALSAFERDANDVFEDLQTRIAPQNGPPLEAGMVGKYRHIVIQDRPPALTGASSSRLSEMITEKNIHLEWALLCATVFQRPLYVGKAVNLSTRIRQHLRTGSKLSRGLEQLNLTPGDCTVVLLPVQPPDDVLELAASLRQRTDSPDADEEDLDADIEDVLDDGSDEDDFDEFDAEEELPADAPVELRQADQLVRLAESLTIRLAHPLLNEKMD